MAADILGARRRRGARRGGPGTAPGDRRRPRTAVRAHVPGRGAAGAARAHHGERRDASRARRPQDEQVARQHDHPHGRPARHQGADPADRHGLRAARAAQGPRRLHADRAPPRVRRRLHHPARPRRATATAPSATARPRRCSRRSSSSTSPRCDDRYERLRAEPAALHERLIEGEQLAARRADQVLTRAMTAMGL